MTSLNLNLDSVTSAKSELPAPNVLHDSLLPLKVAAPEIYQRLMSALDQTTVHVVIAIPTHVIRPSLFANRHADSLRGLAFEQLKSSICHAGRNTQPILIRNATPLAQSADGGDTLYEIVAGHRRHLACRELGLPVYAIVVPNLSDSELVVAMHNENHARAPLSPFEYGSMLVSWLEKGLFLTQRRLAEHLGCEHTAVSRAIGVAKLPMPVVRAFNSPLDIQYRDAELLKPVLEAARNAVLAAAEEMADMSPKLRRPEVLKRLLAAAADPGVGSSNKAKMIDLKDGDDLLGQVTWDGNRQIRVTLSQSMSPDAKQHLHAALLNHLQKVLPKAGKKPRSVAATGR